ncbi:5587_t:CDS:2 [Funneliformis caledonium]|uniref:5587_t:CDS:1 n=1 Tax=Funneliformis caledonium TaxID=1117310 RepID=A0A9N9DJB7_9GLOM|nr:5587_t:CDS:2 [Funneliformis caledonium]
MNKYKITSLQEEKGRNQTPYSYWKNTPHLEDISHPEIFHIQKIFHTLINKIPY